VLFEYIYRQNGIHAHFELMVGLNPSWLVLHVIIFQEEFKDTKGLSESIKSLKDRQCNGQKKKEKQLSTKLYTEN